MVSVMVKCGGRSSETYYHHVDMNKKNDVRSTAVYYNQFCLATIFLVGNLLRFRLVANLTTFSVLLEVSMGLVKGRVCVCVCVCMCEGEMYSPVSYRSLETRGRIKGPRD
jgi:hypothetical protein